MRRKEGREAEEGRIYGKIKLIYIRNAEGGQVRMRGRERKREIEEGRIYRERDR